MNTSHLLLWLLSIALIVVGIAGTLLPALPGTALVLAGIVLGAWIDDFTQIGWGMLAVVGVLAVLLWVLDYAAGLMGAKRGGQSAGLAARGHWHRCWHLHRPGRPAVHAAARRRGTLERCRSCMSYSLRCSACLLR